jgi:hypothetical protein
MFDNEEKKEIEQIIRAVLKQDPDNIIEARIDKIIYGDKE